MNEKQNAAPRADRSKPDHRAGDRIEVALDESALDQVTGGSGVHVTEIVITKQQDCSTGKLMKE